MSSRTSSAKYGSDGWPPSPTRSGKIAGFAFQKPKASGFLAQIPDQLIVGDPKQPGAGILGKTVLRPGRERSHERTLDRILHELDVLRAGPTREHGHQPAVFVPEEMLNQSPCCQGPAISRISMLDPGLVNPGLSRATSSARS